VNQASVTPEGATKHGQVTPRSKKRLDMIKPSLSSPGRLHGSPLSERQNIPSPLRTPSNSKYFCPDSPASSSRLTPDHSRSPSPNDDQSENEFPMSYISENLPSTIPRTPQPCLRRITSGPNKLLNSGIKLTRKSFSIEKPKKADKDEVISPALSTIVAKSFYSSGSRTPQPIVKSENVLTKSKVKSAKNRRSGGGGSIRMHRSRSSGSLKRKRRGTFGGGGVGHAIKKPKLNKSIESKPVKISELPVPVIVDLPSGSSVYNQSSKTPSRSSMTPTTSGQLRMSGSGSTKVQFEVKAGQFVFRAKAKTSTTPLRRSPRKHMSPLKADYFSGSGGKKVKNKSSSRLFSPESNYLKPENIRSPSKNLPSPVKFVSAEKEEPDLSDLITALAKDQAIELNIPVTEAPVSSFLTNSSTDFPDVSSAINNILNDLSSGEDTDTSSMAAEPSLEGHNNENKTDSGAEKLFPIFYQNNLTNSKETAPILSQTGEKKKFICNSLSENQSIIDAGQKVIGPVQCGTCGSVYSVGDPQEEASHQRIHAGRLEKLKLLGWKNERAVGHFPAGRVLCVKPGDHLSHWKKVEEVLSVVDSDLGFSEVGIRWPEKTKVFIFVADKKVVGLLLSETIDKGYRIIPNSDIETTGKVYCCSETPVPVKCGISRIWVLADYRRSKIASSLVDSMRAGFYQDHYLKDDEFAFSDPTMDGIQFATKYMGFEEFLVYNR